MQTDGLAKTAKRNPTPDTESPGTDTSVTRLIKWIRDSRMILRQPDGGFGCVCVRNWNSVPCLAILAIAIAFKGCISSPDSTRFQDGLVDPDPHLRSLTEIENASPSPPDSPGNADGLMIELVELDREAPKIFFVEEFAVRAAIGTKGGIWVAFHSIPRPERVVVRNPSTGLTVEASLFEGTMDRPYMSDSGAPLLLSPAAADALGVPSGTAVEVTVTALRREIIDAREDGT